MLFYYVGLLYVKTELAVLHNFRHHCICFADDGKIQVVDLQRKYVNSKHTLSTAHLLLLPLKHISILMHYN